MQNDRSWIERSKRVGTLDVEIGFLLQADFYLGDPNDHEQLSDPARYAPLRRPDIVRACEDCVLTGEAIGHEDRLVDYYRQIAEKAASLGKDFNEIRHYFWMRLYVWNREDGVGIAFPWYDALSEIRQFTQWLVSGTDAPFQDLDQGWQVDATRESGRLHVRQSDPDGEEEYDNLEAPIGPVVQQAAEAEARASVLVARLTEGR